MSKTDFRKIEYLKERLRILEDNFKVDMVIIKGLVAEMYLLEKEKLRKKK